MPETTYARAQPGARVETPLCRVAQRLAGLTGWRRYGSALLLGALMAGALPPFDIVPLLLVSFPGLLWLEEGSTSGWSSFWLGYVFGFGFFVAGLYWIAAALLVDIQTFWWLIPLAGAGLPLYFGVLTGLASLALRLGTRFLGLSGPSRILLFAIAWSLAEWVRGHLFTGFPWNLVGYCWSGGFPGAAWVLQSVSWFGMYGLSLATVLAASLPALLGFTRLTPPSPRHRLLPQALAAGLILVPGIAGGIRLWATPPAASETYVRLVQPSILQTLKWDPGTMEANFRRLTTLSAQPAPHPLSATLWPEAAATYLLERDGTHRDAVGAVAPPDGYVLTGAPRAEPLSGPPRQIWNSIDAVTAEGTIAASYDKAHLVPFGEFMPLRDWIPLKKVTPGNTDFTAGSGPVTIALPGLPPFAPLICYEVIFPGEVVDRANRPDWLLNVTNDAWYGRSTGPFQHFAITRARAVEEGLPLVRVANNGISGVIDPLGRVVGRMDLDTVGYADLPIPAALPATPFARLGNWMFLLLLTICAVPVALRWRD